MDPITHGITGSLLGKGFFSKRNARVATFAATLGAVFPDIDVFTEAFARDPLSIIKYHRGITHSFVALPLFAALLAWLTRACIPFVKRKFPACRDIEAPSWSLLTAIYGAGIASHIILDGMTSFGTRMLAPISQQRVAWDLLFIIDFIFTSIVLLPQVAAWIFSIREKSRGRAAKMWMLFTIASFLAWKLADAVGYTFHLWIAVVASLLIAALFFLPAHAGWGFRVERAVWCRAGTYAMVLYLAACWLAHHTVMQRVKSFAAENHIAVDRMAALPLPPSILSWGGVIRSNDGVYQSRYDLRHLDSAAFTFTADSPPDRFVARAMELPDVRLYWGFARFPVIRTWTDGDHHAVEFGENRFVNPRRRRPQPFTYIVLFDSDGELIQQGWEVNGIFLRSMQQIPHHGVTP